MKTLHRNKRKLYLCKAIYDENTGRRKFEAPIEIYENWQVTNTDAEFMNIGLELFNYARIRTSLEHKDYYHVGDRVYLFTTPPVVPVPDTSVTEEETTETTDEEIVETTDEQTVETPVQEEPTPTYDEFATTADYQVYKDPIITLNECTIWLQKLSGKNAQNNIY